MHNRILSRTRTLIAVAAALVVAPLLGAAPPAHAGTGLTDVPGSNQFHDEIGWLADEGITTGWPDHTFRPKSAITREAMAAFLYRFAGSPDYEAPSSSPFSDVARSNQFYKEISWLADKQVTEGWDDHTFRPKNRITREAMAAFLYRYSGKADLFATDKGAGLTDVPNSNQFHEAIRWLSKTGITTGWPDHTFRPESFITREAMAAFLYRYDDVQLPRHHFNVRAELVTAPIIDGTNKHRSAQGRDELSAYQCLADLAMHNAEGQAAQSRMFHHQNLDKVFADCDSDWAGENVAYFYPTNDEAVDAWWHSPDHKENMLDKHYTGMAAAVAWDKNGVPFYAQVFSSEPR